MQIASAALLGFASGNSSGAAFLLHAGSTFGPHYACFASKSRITAINESTPSIGKAL